MKIFFIVGFGSFLGGGSRYLIQKYLTDSIQSSFPYATLLINISGCFILGFLLGLSNKYNFLSSETRLFLTTGLCGGFTTFSTFSNDSLMLLRDGNYYYFLLYTLLSVVVGIICTFLGYLIFK
jgi:fluoride exporter